MPVTIYQEVWNKMNFRIFHNHQHPASRASFISFFFILYNTEKEALPKPASFFEVSVAPTLGLVIRVYITVIKLVFRVRASTFTRNWWLKLSSLDARKTWRWKGRRGNRAKTFGNSLLSVVSILENFHDSRKHQSASIKSSSSGTDTFVSLPTVSVHGKSLINIGYD